MILISGDLSMPRKFKQKWEEPSRGLRKIVRRSKPLKPQISRVITRLESQNERLGAFVERYDSRDRELFEKVVQANEKHDENSAKVLANELSEVRNQRNLLLHSRLALENVCLRLRTVYEYGNTASAISGVAQTIGNLKSSISSVMPDIGNELFGVERTLGDIVMDIGGTVDTTYNFAPTSEDAHRILKEAAIVAENRVKESLPSLTGSQESPSIT
jgi:division protein CdvB (Snf7/Vps24/ESCRT-III family)